MRAYTSEYSWMHRTSKAAITDSRETKGRGERKEHWVCVGSLESNVQLFGIAASSRVCIYNDPGRTLPYALSVVFPCAYFPCSITRPKHGTQSYGGTASCLLSLTNRCTKGRNARIISSNPHPQSPLNHESSPRPY